MAQQEPNYTQYMFNPLNYNPAYAGNKAILSSALVYRNQWAGFEGAPKIVTFSAHSPLKNKNMGVGLEVTNDKIGPVSNLWIQASYAYRIRISRISKGKLGFGVKAGLLRSSYDWNKIVTKDASDGYVGANQINSTTPVFDFGIYYHKTNQSFAGATLKNLNNPSVNLKTDYTTGDNRQNTMIVLTYGKIIEFNERVVFRPSILFQSAFLSSSKPLVDVNLSLLFDQVFWVGMSYRTGNTVAAVLEYEISEQFKIGYSYDYYFNELSKYSSGSHEIFIGFNYNVFKSRMRSPRYYF
jgi:type IX secretion system PorP/SprF family membrane protein